ncbi:uncharacterized protein PHACADRAFT_181398 [Phanerochaete carnosa HHB-10118-sp]|uniref:F-box domain-containing protein n=1 Tax=Phanerochaete carnosa (strain HHB-10118-sp) TaxID=650164 RepID=K5W661_PHACS|nr:uncharacterized protein PHACADRAFT_181398 [Phanerochaete carnosa HHB-10118-sp]EKM59398.1 hypothetical protein PHACADRAFT_181398 [Phanerochaete carnosa HHB-10118-sp]
MSTAQGSVLLLLLLLLRSAYDLLFSSLSHILPSAGTSGELCSSSRSPRLPVEVSERIIDFVNASFVGYNHETDKDKRATLLACALTCRSWRPRSQLHLYHFVILDDKSQLQSFADSLHQNSELGTYVFDLAIRGNRAGIRFPSGIEQWTALLVFNLRFLPHLERLTLKWCDWRCLHRSFFAIISYVPSITSLSLSSIRLHASKELVYLVCSFPNLLELVLFGVQCSDARAFPLIKRARRNIPLHILRIYGPSCASAGAVLRTLHVSSSGTRIQILQITARHKATQLELGHFLSGCGSLEELDLFLDMDQLKPGKLLYNGYYNEMSNFYSEPEEFFDLSKCIHLRRLQIKYSQMPASNRLLLSQTLSTVPAAAMVSAVKISLLEERRDIALLNSINWEALDSVLDTPKFRSLNNVTVWICVWVPIPVDFVEKLLPRLHQRKLLTSELRLH